MLYSSRESSMVHLLAMVPSCPCPAPEVFVEAGKMQARGGARKSRGGAGDIGGEMDRLRPRPGVGNPGQQKHKVPAGLRPRHRAGRSHGCRTGEAEPVRVPSREAPAAVPMDGFRPVSPGLKPPGNHSTKSLRDCGLGILPDGPRWCRTGEVEPAPVPSREAPAAVPMDGFRPVSPGLKTPGNNSTKSL